MKVSCRCGNQVVRGLNAIFYLKTVVSCGVLVQTSSH